MGVEPTHPPWQGSRLPLHHGRLLATELSKIESTGRDSNPRSRFTGAVSWPLDDQCLFFSGTGGNRTLTRLGKNHDPAHGLKALLPCARLPLTPQSHFYCFQSARWELNPGHRRLRWSLRLIRRPLSPLSYAPVRVGSEGIEPTPCGLKVRCAAFTPRPLKVGQAYVF